MKLAVPRDEAPTINVASKLLQPHQATLWARQRLEEAVKDHYGRLQVGGGYHPALCMRRESMGRALLLIDTVVKALVGRGHEVLVTPYHPMAEPTIILQVSGERLGLQLEERL